MPTTTHGFVYPATSYTGGIVAAIAALTTSLETYATATDLTTIPEYATTSARAAAIPSPTTGRLARLTTEAFPRRYNGSSWVPYGTGNFTIIPTSVAGTGVSLGSGGKVSFSASTSVSVNGCFTSDFTNYLVVFDFTTSAAAALNVVLRASGTNATTAYDSQRVNFQNATVTASQTLNSSAWVGSGGLGDIAARHVGTLTLYGPAVTAATGGLIHNGITMNAMTTTAAIYDGLLQHRTSSAYDGFSFSPGSGNITGSIYVYGYNAN